MQWIRAGRIVQLVRTKRARTDRIARGVAGCLVVDLLAGGCALTTLSPEQDADIVNVQEDFNSHAALYANDNHPFCTATRGGAGIGSGLNTMSSFPCTATGSSATFTAPAGWQIVGFHGRSGAALDKVGLIYAPIP